MICENLSAQGVYVSVNHPVYQFLEKIAVRYDVSYSKIVLPKTRIEIARYITLLLDKKIILNSVEKEELAWYEGEFFHDIEKIDGN